MRITLRTFGKEGQIDTPLEVPEGRTVASAAWEQGINLYGGCRGAGRCMSCMRGVIEGLHRLFDLSTKKPATAADADCPQVRTCFVTPIEEGAIIHGCESELAWWLKKPERKAP